MNYKKVPLCLNGEIRKGNRYKFDFGLPNSDSLFQIDFIDSDLKITYTKSKLIVSKDQEHLVEVSLDEGMTSAVYLDVFDDYMVLNHSAGHTILPILEDTNEISLNLVKAFLKGYQQTKIFS
ncbi:hypothetical protein [Enterococcus sp. OL5]|uniref:hypothetical protein n=1 Tax=Enterococcus sp. OL5 TaxID=2590214 RepID=UPI001129BD66|nr:hypothetical protein [Enterococcus sp. OL5]TPR56880.1 hypothetical protein FJU10_10860 [Enterococcus sp. OL5]